MCDACKAMGSDPSFLNGEKNQMVEKKLYGVFTDEVKVTLCYLHDLELFLNGEKKFMGANLELLRYMVEFQSVNRFHYNNNLSKFQENNDQQESAGHCFAIA